MDDSRKVNDDNDGTTGTGGTGGKSERGESGRTSIQDARMTARAIEQGWIPAARWDTHKPKSVLLAEIRERGDLTLVERTTLAVYELLENRDERPKGIGARCAIAMERQNQIDQLAALNAGNDPLTQGAPPVAPDAIAAAMDDTVPAAAG